MGQQRQQQHQHQQPPLQHLLLRSARALHAPWMKISAAVKGRRVRPPHSSIPRSRYETSQWVAGLRAQIKKKNKDDDDGAAAQIATFSPPSAQLKPAALQDKRADVTRTRAGICRTVQPLLTPQPSGKPEERDALCVKAPTGRIAAGHPRRPSSPSGGRTFVSSEETFAPPPSRSRILQRMDTYGNKCEDESQCAEEEEEEEEEVDPRIQGELEKLNQSTDDINRWERELEDFRQRFRLVLAEATLKLDDVMKRIGRAVEESKPYWEARKVARQAQIEAQQATQEFQRAVEILRAAKETIALAEERLLEEDTRQFDSAWQEMLNHATQRVMEAEQARTRSEAEHRKTAANYNACISHMKQLEKKLKRSISKSRPYFELKPSIIYSWSN
ncbi:SH3 domain-binding protein 5 [Oryzias melastigma]|uniref:SH3 domain-binding protein 5 n=1 Tax=Oryzias melastigma TaxID=30732 RepID=A0A834FCV7_ORYME|nr:SH3 domain-binding protein 5 [Oryzias melastigma]